MRISIALRFPRCKIDALCTLLTLEKLRDSPYSLIVNTPDKHFEQSRSSEFAGGPNNIPTAANRLSVYCSRAPELAIRPVPIGKVIEQSFPHKAEHGAAPFRRLHRILHKSLVIRLCLTARTFCVSYSKRSLSSPMPSMPSRMYFLPFSTMCLGVGILLRSGAINLLYSPIVASIF